MARRTESHGINADGELFTRHPEAEPRPLLLRHELDIPAPQLCSTCPMSSGATAGVEFPPAPGTEVVPPLCSAPPLDSLSSAPPLCSPLLTSAHLCSTRRYPRRVHRKK